MLKPNMTNDVIIEDGKSVYADAHDTAGSGWWKTDYRKPLSGDPPVGEHDMDSDITTSINHVKRTYPQCVKSTLRAEIPDKYEA